MSENLDYASILESISGGFFALDNEFRITYWNRAAAEGTGMESPQVLGKNVFEVFPNASGAPLGDVYREAMSSRSFRSIETCYKDARFEAWYDVRVYPARSGLSVFFQDITEKKRDERRKEVLGEVLRAINESRHLDELCLRAAEKIALLLEVPARFVCVYLYDPRGNEVRLVAPAILDVELPQDAVHQPVTEGAAHPASQAAYTGEAVITGDLRRSVLWAPFESEIGSARLKTLLALPLRAGGDLQGVLEVLTIKEPDFVQGERDLLGVISHELANGMSRKRLVDELRTKNLELEAQTQKTLEASDTLKKFLATFSHELRSPLNSIIGFSELLTTQFEGLPPESIREFMQNINTSGRHLQQIINDILDLSKIEAGKMDLHIASYPVSYFEESIKRVLSAAIAEKQMT
ncbi:MAG: histidine kinase dimerization/phospho-acceptor domain-containing protein, partial [Bacteroidota bacterium]